MKNVFIWLKGFGIGVIYGLKWVKIILKDNKWYIIPFAIDIILIPIKLVVIPILLLIKPVRNMIEDMVYDIVTEVDDYEEIYGE